MKPTGKYIYLLFSALIISNFCFAQAGTTSSYSSHGIGQINDGIFSSGIGMANTGIATSKSNLLNFSNPASYSGLQITVFETALKSNLRKSFFADSNFTSNTSSLAYLAFGFPVSPKFGMSFGVLPLSSSGYNVYSETTDVLFGKVRQQYESSGGVNQLYLGTGYKISKNFSVGVNASYLFGSLEKMSKLEFPDLPNSFYSRITTNNSFSNFYAGFGLQFVSNPLTTAPGDSLARIYKLITELKSKINSAQDSGISNIDSLKSEIKSLKKSTENIVQKRVAGNWKISSGLIFNPEMKVGVKQKILAERYRYTGTGSFLTIEDTTDNSTYRKKFTLPVRIGYGISLHNDVSWGYAFDVSYADWSVFDEGNGPVGLQPAIRFAFGLEHTPNSKKSKSYFRRLQYRTGGYYEQSMFQINGSQLSDFGMTFGVGFPLKKSGSMVNISAGAGLRGSNAGKNFEEQYVNFTLGLVINEKWFLRKKFD